MSNTLEYRLVGWIIVKLALNIVKITLRDIIFLVYNGGKAIGCKLQKLSFNDREDITAPQLQKPAVQW